MQRLPFCACKLGQFFRLAEDPNRLVRYLFTQSREPHYASGPLDQYHAQQGFQFAQAGGKGGLGYKAGLGSLAEMPMLAQRNKILQLLDGRRMDGHCNRKFQSVMPP